MEEELGNWNQAKVEFTAAPGERNALTVTAAGGEGDDYRIQLTDAGAPIEAGAKCSGGGQAGEPVTCAIPRPRYSATCPRTCPPYGYSVPGTSWTALVDVHLGDEDDSLDASSLPDEPGSGVHVNVDAGPGNDTIATGSPADTIEAGPGDDIVHSGGGRDHAIAGPGADGSDFYDLGGGDDEVSYARRTTPLEVEGGDVRGAGEHDTLAGVEYLVGGLGADRIALQEDPFKQVSGGDGDDVMEGGPERDEMYGGEGDDVLRGNGGNDLLVGGGGSDLLVGGAGNDALTENVLVGEESFAVATGSAGGADTADGGPGNDFISLGDGPDTASGGEGDDSISGGPGNDRLLAGPGDDKVAGEAGADAMWGGAGRDELLAGRIEEGRYPFSDVVDSWSDRLDCGGGRDLAVLNRWDRRRHCEQRTLVRLVRFTKREHFADGTVDLVIDVQGAGRMAVFGRGMHKAVRRVDAITTVGQHSATVTVRAQGGALRALRRRGHVTLRVAVRFRPRGGLARTEWARVRLVKRG